MNSESEFLRWAELALQAGACEVKSTCAGTRAGSWYTLFKCSRGHKSRVFACCGGCGYALTQNPLLSCGECGVRLAVTNILVLAKVTGEGLETEVFPAGLAEVGKSGD